MKIFPAIDLALRRGLPAVCGTLLVVMILFTIYTVIMRTVFLNPPFWGDTLTLFANVWLVMLALALSIRERQSIAMQMIYGKLPEYFGLIFELIWIVLFAAVGVIMVVCGYQAATLIPGAYWELGNLPKSYPMMILPIAGLLIVLAAGFVFVEDIGRLRRRLRDRVR